MVRAARAVQRAPLLWLAASAALGITLADGRNFGTVAILVPGCIALALALRKRSRGLFLVAAGCAAALALGAWRQHGRILEISGFPLAESLEKGKAVEVAGTGWVEGPVETGERSVLTGLRLTSIQIGGREFACDHRVPAWIQKLAKGLEYGRELRFSGTLMPHEGPLVPGGFDAREFYYRSRGSLAKLEIREGDRLELLPGAKGNPLIGAVRKLRARMEDALLAGVPDSRKPHARLIAAMALGAKEHSPEDLEAFFRMSGTMHLFAVSGLHVAIVAGILLGLTTLLRIPKARAVPVMVLLLGFYALLTGLSPSSVRAALMASVMLAGFALREQGRLINSLGLAALLLLLIDPQQLFLPGFQLTFVVLFSIACFARSWSEKISHPLVSDPFLPASLVRPTRRFADRTARVLAASLAVSLASWLGSAGLLSWHFQSVSPVGIVANVVMVPFASWIISLAAVSLAASVLHLGFLAVWTNRINAVIALVLTSLAQWFSSFPGATVHTGGASVPAKPGLLVTAMGDRGDGAFLVQLNRDLPRRWMIDAGSERTYQGQVLPLMRGRGINRIDGLILTHGDQGHLGGAMHALQQFRPGVMFESVLENRSPSYPAIASASDLLRIQKVAVESGTLIEPGEGCRFRILHPVTDAPGRLADDRALVMRLEYGRFSILFTSDSGFETEKALLERRAVLASDVWIRGQAREGPSGLAAFADAVRPEVVLSSHADFPKSERIPESLRRHLSSRNIPLFEIGDDGPLEVRIQDGTLEIHALAEGGRELLRLPPSGKN